MRVLVTGATAAFGRAVVEALLADPAVEQVLAVGREPGPPAPGRDGRFAYRPVDLTRPRELHDLLFGDARRLALDTLVHTAHHRDARLCGREPHALHVEATRGLVSAAQTHPTLRTFVYRSFGDVYRLDAEQPVLLGEDAPLEFSPAAPQWVRDRVEADVGVCTRVAQSRLRLVVLRFAEILAPGTGSQLRDYLRSRVCLRPLGFDPMLNLLSLEDAVAAMRCALAGTAPGVFNVPGADTLPLSRVAQRWGRLDLGVPGPLLSTLYRARASTLGMEFRYDVNFRRFHFSGVLDGTRARELLGYVPTHRIVWPH